MIPLLRLALTLLIANAALLTVGTLLYLFVIRRRAKIQLLVDHLAELSRRGLPLQAGLRAVAADLGGMLEIRLDRVARRLEEGRPAAEAFEEGGLPPFLLGMIALGDRSGNLAGFLGEARRSYRGTAGSPQRSIVGFLYPLLVTLLINGSLLLGAASLRPVFGAVLESMKLTDSWTGAWPWLVAASEAMFLFCVLLAAFLCAGGVSGHFAAVPFRPLRRLLDRILLFLPLAGRALRDGSQQAFTLSVGLLLRAGADLPTAAAAAASAEPNELLRRRYERLAAHLREGGRVSTLEGRGRLFPADFLWFLESGEASGALADGCRQAALHFEARAQDRARAAMRALVPAFAVVNGALVLGALLLVFLPLTAILTGVSTW